MTTLSLDLTAEEMKWLDDWSVLSAYQSPQEGIREVLKTCGAIPKGHEYFKQRFNFAE